MAFQGVYLMTSIGLNLTSRTEFYAVATFAAAAVGLGGGVLLMPRYGAVGASIAFLLSYFTQASVALAFAQRFYPVRYEVGRLARIVCAGAVAALVALWTVPALPPVAGFFVRGLTDGCRLRRRARCHRILSRDRAGVLSRGPDEAEAESSAILTVRQSEAPRSTGLSAMVLLNRRRRDLAFRLMQTDFFTTRRLTWALGVVCAVGFGLRVWALDFGLPGVYNPDEIPILNRALALAKGDPNPHNFLYPSLYFYALFVWEALFFAIGRLVGLYPSLSAFQNEFFLDPSRIILAGRALGAVCGTVTLLATYHFARRLYGPAVGVAAALFLAVAPFAVRDAHYVKLDVPVTMMTVIAHVAIARLVVDPAAAATWRAWAVAGFLAGLAVSTQYYVIFVVIALVAAAAADRQAIGQLADVAAAADDRRRGHHRGLSGWHALHRRRARHSDARHRGRA